MSRPTLHLASASPRRREILTTLGLRFSYAGEDVDEHRLEKESATDMVMRLACAKARAAEREHGDAAVLGADTAVVLGDRILGKPESKDEALQMLAALSGRSHDVLTGVVVLHRGDAHTALSRSRVSFRRINSDEAERYWRTGEPGDKAGGYAIQGLAAVFVTELNGSYSGVVGLPIYETAALLGDIGIDIFPE